VVRMPLEVELRRNYKHSLTGQKLRDKLELRLRRDEQKAKNKYSAAAAAAAARDSASRATTNATRVQKGPPPPMLPSSVDEMEIAIWYATAQTLVKDEMTAIASAAGSDGQLDSSTLSDAASEVLQLFLDHQETWQEVCLVLEHSVQSATTLVLNRPLALQLTDALGKMVLYGTFSSDETQSRSERAAHKAQMPTIKDFLKAFGSECGVYLGGPDDQHLPAIMVHGIADLEGATEIAAGTGLYQGGIKAAVAGVLAGRYKPLEFRFFVGRHSYSTTTTTASTEIDWPLLLENVDEDEAAMLEEVLEDGIPSSLDLEVVLGKYQPIACARSLALKQCIQLPKPLWNEVLELCGGELSDISEFEQLKPDDMQFQIIDTDDDDDDDDEYDIVILEDGDDDDDDSYEDDEDDEEEYYMI
jgi:Uncharacterized ACR, COG1678